MINICEAENKKYQQLPEKVLQFGEGNFLRAFADWYVEKANEKNLLAEELLSPSLQTGEQRIGLVHKIAFIQ